MATIVLQAAGAYLGGFLGTTAAAIGSAAGALAGYVVDRALLSGGVKREGPRLSSAQAFTAEEGAPLPRLYGAARLSGTLIWATRFQERSRTERQGFKGGPKTTTYSYTANVAFAICEGPIAHVRRIWADGRELDLDEIEVRIHRGGEDQAPDPLIEAKQGSAGTPAFRGTAYAVFDNFPLEDFGNRFPQVQFEVLRPLPGLSDQVRAVALVPGSTEYGLATTRVRETRGPGETRLVNRHVLHASTDIVASLDELQALCPAIEDVAIVVTWFGDDLRAGVCRIKPGVTDTGGDYSMPWSVAGVNRSGAKLMSSHGGGAAYGGTPTDQSVIEAIQEVRRRGLKATLYPFVMMDVPAGNALPNPYGGPDANIGQPAYPWRGRITAMPAPGQPGTADKTAAARTQINAFVGTSGDFGYRRMVMHYAGLAVAAGGVDAFLLGSELRGLTTLRDAANAFPFVEALCALAADVRAAVGTGTKITYGADWSEYFGHHPADGSGDLFFHLDPLWVHPAINAVGIDSYTPLSDWRDEDYAGGNPDGFDGPYDAARLKANVAAGEGFDWYYASDAARKTRTRTPITDGAYGKPWMFRYKDLVGWWSNAHYNRIGGIQQPSPTAWVPQGKPIWLTELGCPATDKGPNQPNVFPDPKSSESSIPYFSDGGRSDLAQSRYLEAQLDHWDPAAPGFLTAKNPVSTVYGGRMIDPARIWLWSWDARPFPAFPLQGTVWSDGDNWLNGHWLNGRLEKPPLGSLIEAVLSDCGVADVDASRVEGSVHGYVVAGPASARAALEPLLDLFAVGAADDGTRLVFSTMGRQASTPPLLADLAFGDGEDETVLARTLTAGVELPDAATLSYRDPLRDYQAGAARAKRPRSPDIDSEALDSQAMLEAGEAEGLAADWLRRRVSERETASFVVPAQDRTLEPGTVFRLEGKPGEYLATAIEEGVARRVAARRIVRQPPTPRRVSLPAPVATVPTAESLARTLFLDLPTGPAGGLPEEQLRVACFARPWTPQTISVSPEADFFDDRALLTLPAVMGTLGAPAPAGIEGRVSHATIMVTLFGGELSSVSRQQTLNGANAAAIRSASGAWEIVQFETATEFSASTWRLGGLLRGQLGTDDAMRAGAPAGADFVLLDKAVIAAGLRANEIGLALNWRVGPAGRAFSSETSSQQLVTGGLRARKPYSPVHARAKPDGAGGLAVSWIRRARTDADSWQGSDIPLDEASERYRIEIAPAGGATLRSTEVSAPSWIYAAAQAATDFPSRPATIEIAVRQLSVAGVDGVERRISQILS